MKKTYLFASLLCVLISGFMFAADGDMGGASQNGSEAHPYLIEDINDFITFANPNNAATSRLCPDASSTRWSISTPPTSAPPSQKRRRRSSHLHYRRARYPTASTLFIDSGPTPSPASRSRQGASIDHDCTRHRDKQPPRRRSDRRRRHRLAETLVDAVDRTDAAGRIDR